jgi:hypothetical protein
MMTESLNAPPCGNAAPPGGGGRVSLTSAGSPNPSAKFFLLFFSFLFFLFFFPPSLSLFGAELMPTLLAITTSEWVVRLDHKAGRNRGKNGEEVIMKRGRDRVGVRHIGFYFSLFDPHLIFSSSFFFHRQHGRKCTGALLEAQYTTAYYFTTETLLPPIKLETLPVRSYVVALFGRNATPMLDDHFHPCVLPSFGLHLTPQFA